MTKKIVAFFGLFLIALVFAWAIINFLSDPTNLLAMFFVALFVLSIVGLVPLLFVIAWLKNENNIRERVKDVKARPLSPEFRRLLLEMVVHVLFR